MKKVLITGSTGAIGEAIAREFDKNNYMIYLHYVNNQEKALKLQKELKNTQLIQFDLKNTDQINNVLENLDIDVLINNAGIIRDKHFYWMNEEDWSEVIDTNLNGLFRVTKAISSKMVASKKGSIVNVASVSGLVGNNGQANYSASKGAMIAFTKSLCLDLAPFGIRINAVAPGVIASEMTQDMNEKDYKKIIPQGRFGKPCEVAEVVFFLADKATYINGEVINISGGMVR